ncbi:MAG: hypothetical protein C5B52_15255 [Bacteroidetes bacterium]|nr:MAG: hypothetical protein C5B52_15255 [Bacteroidota bacterium]
MSFKKLIFQSIIWRGFYFVSVLMLNVFIARYFQASNSGSIYFIINALAFYLLPVSICLEAGIGYFTATKEIRIYKLANFSFFWALLIGSIITIFLLIFGPGFSFLTQNKGNLFIPLYYLCGCMLTNYAIAIMYANRNFTLPNIVLILINFALVAFLVLTRNNPGAKSIFIQLYFLGFLVQGIILSIVLVAENFEEWKLQLPGSREISKIIRYSLQALAANIIFFLVYRIDYWFVSWYCSAADLGNYIQVSKLVQIFLLIPIIIASVIFPYIASGKTKESVAQVKSICHLLCLLFSIACLFLAIAGMKLFPLLFGSSFDKMYEPFLLVIPGILSLAIYTPVSAYFSGVNKVRMNIYSSCIGLVVIVVGDLIWIPKFGIRAAALVSSIGYFTCLCFSIIAFMRIENASLSNILLFDRQDFDYIKSIIKRNGKNSINES